MMLRSGTPARLVAGLGCHLPSLQSPERRQFSRAFVVLDVVIPTAVDLPSRIQGHYPTQECSAYRDPVVHLRAGGLSVNRDGVHRLEALAGMVMRDDHSRPRLQRSRVACPGTRSYEHPALTVRPGDQVADEAHSDAVEVAIFHAALPGYARRGVHRLEPGVRCLSDMISLPRRHGCRLAGGETS